MRPLARLLLFSIAPICLYAHVTGFPLGYAGVNSTLASDNGGQTCAQCHTGLAIVQGGTAFTLHVSSYTPGVQQTISLTMSNTGGARFAFQLTARLQSDLTKAAGTFTKTVDSQPYCANGSPFSCNGDIQYVTNTPGAIFPSAGGRQWGLTWTPPGRDLGPVVFYAVAVSGNNDGTPLNDRVYVISGFSVSAAPCNLAGTPQFNAGNRAVLDSAAFRGTIASKGLIVILGSNLFLANSQPGGYLLSKNDLINGQWPTQLGCVAVQISGPNLPSTRIPIYYVSESLIKAQAPTIPARELVDVQIVLNPDATKPTLSAAYQVQADTVSPALYTFNSQGTGNAAAVDVTKGKLLADTSVIPSAVSASPGDIISLYGTGFGDTDPLYAAGQFAALPPATLPRVTTTPVSVTIGGVAVPASDIKYAGLAFDAPGFYVINVRVPQLPDGDQAVSIVLGNAGTQGNVNIPVKNP